MCQQNHHSMMCQQLRKKRVFSSITTSNNCVKVLKERRRVRFSKPPKLDVTICESESASHQYPLDEEGNSTSVNNIWYTRRELAVFTKRARDHVLGNQSQEENTRGYERYDFARTQQKTLTRKIILLLMQQKALSDEEKSLIAGKTSGWAVEEAFVRGCVDFCEAYHPQMSHVLKQQHEEQLSVTSTTLADNVARSCQQRNKRRKLNNVNNSGKCLDIRSRVA